MDATASGARLTIGQLSARTGASHRSLRHYEAQGLLIAHRGANGYRSYGEEAVEVVRRIKALLALGLSLRTVAGVLPCVRSSDAGVVAASACPELRETLDTQLARLETVESKVHQTRQAIAAVLLDDEPRG
jgi:DNA-binding transcriptional MerR regulator